MSCTKFKLTTVATLVLAATHANAALYNVVEVVSPITANDVYGVAIQPADIDRTTADSEQLLGCFGTDCTASDYKLAGETRDSVEAVSYREEVPFAMDNSFRFIQEWSDFDDYCYYELRYSTCNSWASQRWDTWSLEKNDFTYVNGKAFVEDGDSYTETTTVINSLTDSGIVVGNRVVLGEQPDGVDSRNKAFPATTEVEAFSQSRAWQSDDVYTVGSVSESVSNENGSHHSSKATLWSDSAVKQLDWGSGGVSNDDHYLGQGSLRAFHLNGTELYAVGYNTYTDQHMNATVFKITLDSAVPTDLALATYESSVISGAQRKIGSDYIHNNSVATDINDNLFVIGTAQRDGDTPENGAVNNRLFVIPDASVETPTATFLAGGIFFNGAGGEANAVNNFNEIVGQIDADSNREVDGKQRRRRAFIYPYSTTSTEPNRSAIFADQAWWLDDLTNDGNVSGNNNNFRIINASDINDAGVISATAIKCTVNGEDVPYDTTSHNSYCGGADSSAVEKVVAVKLVPINGATASDIKQREVDTASVERQGASLGWLALTLLGFIGFRRK